MGLEYDPKSVQTRLKKAQAWLEQYNEEEIIRLRESKNEAYFSSLHSQDRSNISKLRTYLEENTEASIKDLDLCVYGIPKNDSVTDEENKKLQRTFFTHVYQLLIGEPTGPRLSTFLWALPREQVMSLLEFN